MDFKRLVLIDGHSLLFRAFYAFPPLHDSQGRVVNAVYGFTMMLLNMMAELDPEYIALTFDTHGGTFRNQLYEGYKANRSEPPEDFLPQIPITQEVVTILGIPLFAQTGWEADDLIGTLSGKACERKDIEVLIVTADKDMFQLVKDPCIKVFVPARGKVPSIVYDEIQVAQKMGVTPDQIVDFKALSGDSSDNIPGVKGIGPKTAMGLLETHQTLENLYSAIEAIQEKIPLDESSAKATKASLKAQAQALATSPSVLQKLLDDKANAFLSQQLAEIKKDAPIDLDVEACLVRGYDKAKAVDMFMVLGFKSLISRLPADEFEYNVQDALF